MDDMSEREQAILSEWTRSVYDAALHAEYIASRWRPSDGAILRLNGYFGAGLTPAEAADALFSTHH